MPQNLEKFYLLLFQCVGNGSQLAQCNVSWPPTRFWFVLLPDPIIFAPWSVLLGVGKRCGSCSEDRRNVVCDGQARHRPLPRAHPDVCQKPISEVKLVLSLLMILQTARRRTRSARATVRRSLQLKRRSRWKS